MDSSTVSWAIEDIVDLDRYPVDRPGTDGYVAARDAARNSLRVDGCAVITELVRPDALAAMSAESHAIKPATHYSQTRINAYFGTEPDPTLPDRHPGNIFIERTSGFTPGDAFPEHSPIDAMYRWEPLLAFIADCLEIPELHCYADPLACLTINVLNPSQQFSWHYDNNDFAVTVLLDEADEGGLFRYAPNIRSRTDENAEGAAAVMLGDDRAVTTLELRPGDMQIFQWPLLAPRGHSGRPDIAPTPHRRVRLHARTRPHRRPGPHRAALRPDAPDPPRLRRRSGGPRGRPPRLTPSSASALLHPILACSPHRVRRRVVAR